MLSEFGHIDILVNNAAAVVTTEFLGGNVEAMDRSYRANVRAPFVLSQLVAESMAKAGSGTIINISSGAARNPPPPGTAPAGPRFQVGPEYGVSKAALDRLTTGIATHLHENGIAAISVYPGFTMTERLARRSIPGVDMSRAESPEITAKAVSFICKNPMAFTGQIIVARELVEKERL